MTDVDHAGRCAELTREVAELRKERNDLLGRLHAIEQILKPLVDERTGQSLTKLRSERNKAMEALWRVRKVRCWTNEDGHRFVFARDLYRALEGDGAES